MTSKSNDPRDPASDPALDFQVNRDDFRDCRFVDGSAGDGSVAPLEDGQVLFSIDRFALTSNNISYAAAGDLLNYWGFFPGQDRWGRIPAMAFADVIDSKNVEVSVGARCFGFFPMSRYLTIDAQPNSSGMIDGVAHRAEHAPVYRTYSYSDRDSLYDAAFEDEIILLRGLFMTSFLVDDLLADEGFHGAENVIVTSASSKTSIALAALLQKRSGCRSVGLTSPRNQHFVKGLGLYDEVVLYDEIESLDSSKRSVLVDMAGNGDVIERVHKHLADKLAYSSTVGGTHWEAKPRTAELAGPEPIFFFAPSRIVKRTQDWGARGLQERLGEAWRDFAGGSKRWLEIQHHTGSEALERVYLDALTGRLDPKDGHVIHL